MPVIIRLPGAEIACAAVLFDMDGVLVDSHESIERHLREWAVHHGLDPAHVIERSPGRTNGELIAEVAPHLDAEREARLLLAREVADLDGVAACPGAAGLLASLPGDAWAVVTSGHLPVAIGRLNAAGLPPPKTLVTADDVPRGKPDPAGYLQAAGAIGVPPAHCVVVEDAPAGLVAAKAAGMTAIAVWPNAKAPPKPHDHLLRSLTMMNVVVTSG